MADFCKECSIKIFGKDFGNLAGLISEEKVVNEGLYAVTICEGCGPILVDHEGKCESEDCLGYHRTSDDEFSKNLKKFHDPKIDDIEF